MSSQTTLSAKSVAADTIRVNHLVNNHNHTEVISNGSTIALTNVSAPSGTTLEVQHDGAGGTTAITLPKCEKGYILNILLSTAHTGANTITITTKTSDVYSMNSVFLPGGEEPFVPGENVAQAADDNLITITPDGTNSGVGKGTYIELLGVSDNAWSVRGRGAPMGTGVGGTVVFS